MYVQDYDFPSSSKYLIELDVQEKVLHVRLFEKLYKYISYTSHFQIHFIVEISVGTLCEPINKEYRKLIDWFIRGNRNLQ